MGRTGGALGDPGVPGTGSEGLGAPVEGLHILEAQDANCHALEVVTALSGLDQADGPLRMEDGKRKPWKSGSRTHIRKGADPLGQGSIERGGVEDEASNHRLRRTMPREVQAATPSLDQERKLRQRLQRGGGWRGDRQGRQSLGYKSSELWRSGVQSVGRVPRGTLWRGPFGPRLDGKGDVPRGTPAPPQFSDRLAPSDCRRASSYSGAPSGTTTTWR